MKVRGRTALLSLVQIPVMSCPKRLIKSGRRNIVTKDADIAMAANRRDGERIKEGWKREGGRREE